MFILIGQTLSVTRKSCDINTPPIPAPPIIKARDNRIVFFFFFFPGYLNIITATRS